jgi:hypothetical protein
MSWSVTMTGLPVIPVTSWPGLTGLSGYPVKAAVPLGVPRPVAPS